MQPAMVRATSTLLSGILVGESASEAAAQGAALTVLERYDDAENAFTEALALGPTDPNLHASLRQTRAAVGSDHSHAPGPSAAPSRSVR